MKIGRSRFAAWFAAGVATGAGLMATPYFARADGPNADAARLRKVEDRQAIEELFTAYGVTLDSHDFAAFGRLFAADAVFVSGPGEPARGRPAIQAMLEKTLTSNPSHLPTPDFHLFFNPSIEVDGDRATSRSKGAYVIPDLKNGGAQIIFLVAYSDSFVREAGHWVFQRREIHPAIPAAK
jgi:ketosteroid isomerase-like protein